MKLFKKLVKYKLTRQIKIGLGEIHESTIDKLYDSFLWYLLCFLRKIGRFVRRLYIWIPVIYKTENWDFVYLLNIIETQLKEMEKAHLEDNIHEGNLRRARQIRICIEHIKRFKDISKYTIDNNTDEFLNNNVFIESDKSYTVKQAKTIFNWKFPFIHFIEEDKKEYYTQWTSKDKALDRKHFRVIKHQNKLEDWHWNELWRRLAKYGRTWWS